MSIILVSIPFYDRKAELSALEEAVSSKEGRANHPLWPEKDREDRALEKAP